MVIIGYIPKLCAVIMIITRATITTENPLILQFIMKRPLLTRLTPELISPLLRKGFLEKTKIKTTEQLTSELRL